MRISIQQYISDKAYYSFLLLALPLFILMGCEDGTNAGDTDDTDTTDIYETGEEVQNIDTMEVSITAREFSYNPSEFTAYPGQVIRVILDNQGEAEHNIEFELPSGEEEFDENLQVGQKDTMHIQAPEKIGAYTYYCPVDNHRSQGMVGTLQVRQ